MVMKMIDVNEIKKGDKFWIITNDSVAEIMSVSKENDELKGFMVKVTDADNKEFHVPMSVEFYLEKKKRFRKLP
jgi:hypothetical protein